ncbi:unnamed protein product [Candida verbasci]|uniref:RNase MRP protein 1 RNA binding domain-containing protein n=1 Tax=Candida verbasci TaxID=1227364 RepID=A0A9W4TUY2_9ASCO|nr:unnamed protein product [Candida verbasci]
MDSIIYKELTNEYEILYLIYYRSKNQHRSQKWFKFLNIIIRKLRKMLKLQIDINRLQETMTKRVEYKSKQIVSLANHLESQIFTDAYWSFNSILALGQFITLGFALIGALAKINELLIKIPGVKQKKQWLNIPGPQMLQSREMHRDCRRDICLADDLGEEVSDDYDSKEDLRSIASLRPKPVFDKPESRSETSTLLEKPESKSRSTTPSSLEKPDVAKEDKEVENEKENENEAEIEVEKKKRRMDTIDDIFGEPSKKKKKKKKRTSTIDDIFEDSSKKEKKKDREKVKIKVNIKEMELQKELEKELDLQNEKEQEQEQEKDKEQENKQEKETEVKSIKEKAKDKDKEKSVKKKRKNSPLML